MKSQNSRTEDKVIIHTPSQVADLFCSQNILPHFVEWFKIGDK